MIEDHVAAIARDIDGVHFAFRDVAGAAADEAHDDVVRTNADLASAEADAVAGCGLARDRRVRLGDADGFLQIHDPGDAKHDHSRPFHLAGVAEAAGTGVVEIADEDHFAAAATGRSGAKSLGAWKCGHGVGAEYKNRKNHREPELHLFD